MGLFSILTRTKSSDPESSESEPQKQERRYTAVQVVPPSLEASCDAVRAIAGQRFLAEEAPRLPLTDCDRSDCDCKYLHYTDRRTYVRRDGDVGVRIRGETYLGKCRRSDSRGRRSKDRNGK